MKLETRHAVLASTLAISGCLSGVAFGWAALVVMLKREGAYEELCDRSADDDDGACAAQEVALSRVFSIGILCLFASRLPIGVAVDRLGSRATTAGTRAAAGASASRSGSTGSASGLAGAGPGVHLGAMHVSNLFPEAKRTALGAYSTAHQCSTFVFSLWLPLFNAGASLRQLFRGYAALLLVFGAGCCAAQPRSRYELGDAVAAVWRTEGFRPLLVYKSVSLLSMQFFVAVLQYRLAGRGAAASAMNLAFNVFASFLGLLIAAPLVGPILDRRDDGVALIRRAATAQALGFNALLALSARSAWPLAAELPSYLLWASSRICFFAYFFAHCVKLFGFGSFGTAVGLLSLVGAAVCFAAVQPLCALAFRSSTGIAAVSAGFVPLLIAAHAYAERALLRAGADAATRVVDAGGAELDGAELALRDAEPGRGEARV
ncbi:major facilitator superfamily-like protein [Aureococcus anophagefferens]|nr:major facilitator superfamily-like protein [Aureococcus anophagefferens]